MPDLVTVASQPCSLKYSIAHDTSDSGFHAPVMTLVIGSGETWAVEYSLIGESEPAAVRVINFCES